MRFLQRDDFLNQVTDDQLAELTDDHEDLLLELTEGKAIEEMSNYLSVRYDVTQIFSGVDRSPLVVMYLVDIMLFHLHSRISPDHEPGLRKERYMMARDWLEKVADGFVNPGLPSKTAEEKTSLRYGNSTSKQQHFY